MLRVVGYITQNHDLRLVALACLVCVLATSVTTRLLVPHSGQTGQQSGIRTGAAIVAFSTGVWTTQFISMLAFRPDVPTSFDVPLCILSLVLSVVATTVAFTIRPREPGATALTVASSLVLIAGIGAMHFLGMRSLRMAGVIHFDPDLVIVSLFLGALCMIAAMWLLVHRAAGWAPILLTLAVVSQHFIAMGSVTLQRMGGVAITPLAIPSPGW